MSPFVARTWNLAHGRSITLGPEGVLMGILNVTPDSFSDGGAFHSQDYEGLNVEAAVAAARRMVDDGAAIIDIGGESTRPDAAPIDAETELARVLPVVEALSARTDALLSIDTYRAATGRAAVEAGAHIVNDVSAGLADEEMPAFVRDTGAGFIAMHNSRREFRPRKLPDPIADQLAFMRELEERLQAARIERSRVVLDPGIGFGKDADENLRLVARLSDIADCGLPILLGTSRKRFIGSVTDREPDERDVGTAITTAFGRRSGAAIFRVHDVRSNRDALRMSEALMRADAP